MEELSHARLPGPGVWCGLGRMSWSVRSRWMPEGSLARHCLVVPLPLRRLLRSEACAQCSAASRCLRDRTRTRDGDRDECSADCGVFVPVAAPRRRAQRGRSDWPICARYDEIPPAVSAPGRGAARRLACRLAVVSTHACTHARIAATTVAAHGDVRWEQGPPVRSRRPDNSEIHRGQEELGTKQAQEQDQDRSPARPFATCTHPRCRRDQIRPPPPTYFGS